MTLHLHLVCGPYHLALDTARVIGLCGEDERADLPVVDLRHALAVTSVSRTAKVVMMGGESGDYLLAVDRVVGTIDAAAYNVSPLPAAFRRAAPLFDAVLVQPAADDQLLRLSHDFSPIPAMSPP